MGLSRSRKGSNLSLVWLRWAGFSRRCGAMAAGLLICFAWYYTILAGFYVLYCPVMYVMFINHKFYRKLIDVLFSLWELYPVALFQCCCGTKLHHYGDYINPDESSLIVMNHRTRVDWNYIWLALYHAAQDYEKCICKGNPKVEKQNIVNSLTGAKSSTKFVLKDEIKAVPGLGWIMQLNYFLYLKRNWREDEINISQFVDYYAKIGSPYRIVLFPEGTDLSEENQRRNEKFAEVNRLPKYSYVMHPRTTGWAVLSSQLRRAGLSSIYDVTVAYDNPAQTEKDLLCGNIPEHVHFCFKRYSIDELPNEEEDLRYWLNERWKKKEGNLRIFHSNGNFVDTTTNEVLLKREPRSLVAAKVAFIFWTIIDLFFVYALLNSQMFRFWILYHTFLFVFVTWYFGGFHNIQYKLLEKAKLRN